LPNTALFQLTDFEVCVAVESAGALTHPERGSYLAEVFVPIAEQAGGLPLLVPPF